MRMRVKTLSEADYNERLRALTETAHELIESVQELNRESGNQLVGLTQRAKTNRKLIIGLAISLFIDFLLTIPLTFGFVVLNDTARATEKNAAQLRYNSTVQRQKALCPLYQVFIDSKSPERRAAAQDPQKYDQAFVVIEDGYKVLKCAEFKPPK
jgi:hypothetical protein